MSTSSTPTSASPATMVVDSERPAGNLQNLIDSPTLRWIFVGGKGGVGKTTTSCSLATALSLHRPSVLLISTDPAHNLSDAFGQRFNKNATLVNGYPNLYAMEIDPTVEVEGLDILAASSSSDSSTSALFSDIVSSIPGIDEAMSFAELMKQVTSMQYSVIVFDTAPTGHTLRLLSFPSLLDKALSRLLSLRSKFSPLFAQMSALTGISTSESSVISKLEQTKASIDLINAQFRNPDLTTFVAVCVAEFLSLYETERLVQELAKHEISVDNVVVNQLAVMERGSGCRKCRARERMQAKYLQQIDELYEDMHVTRMPLLDGEVRGTERIRRFATFLLHPEQAMRIAVEGADAEGDTAADPTSAAHGEHQQTHTHTA